MIRNIFPFFYISLLASFVCCQTSSPNNRYVSSLILPNVNLQFPSNSIPAYVYNALGSYTFSLNVQQLDSSSSVLLFALVDTTSQSNLYGLGMMTLASNQYFTNAFTTVTATIQLSKPLSASTSYQLNCFTVSSSAYAPLSSLNNDSTRYYLANLQYASAFVTTPVASIAQNGPTNSPSSGSTSPLITLPIPPMALSPCVDVPPPPGPSGSFTCAQQVAFGKCNADFMVGYCQLSCGKCQPQACIDVPPPPATYSCAQQVAFGKCGASFMAGYCLQSCGTCTTCNNAPPSGNSFTCAQQQAWGKCSADFMSGYCQSTCGTCKMQTPPPTNTCQDNPPPGSAYSCQQQAAWGKCSETWMAGYCTCSCAGITPSPTTATPTTAIPSTQAPSTTTMASTTATPTTANPTTATPTTPLPTTATPTTSAPATTTVPATTGTTCVDVPPGGGYTCAQQYTWGKCTAPWMAGFCLKTCGTCPGNNNNNNPTTSVMTTSVPSNPTTASTRIKNGRVYVSGNSILLNGSPVFLAGVNIAWVNYGNDFTGSSLSQLQSYMQQVRAAGGNSIRLWMHCSGSNSPLWNSDGTVSGLPSTFIPATLAILQYAKTLNMLVNFVLWNFMITDQHAAIYTDNNVLTSYINNALTPLVNAVANDPSANALLSWEISNEPEGASNEFGWQNNKVSMAQIQRAVNIQAHAIHSADPLALVTVGSWSFKAMTDNFGFTNYYSDSKLIAAGGGSYTLGTLDYYQVHYYKWMGRGSLSPIDNPPNVYSLNKPIIVGEFSQSGSINLSIQTLYMNVHDLGYNGAWGWQANGGGQDADSLSVLLAGISALFTGRPQALSFDLNNGTPPTTVATPLPNTPSAAHSMYYGDSVIIHLCLIAVLTVVHGLKMLF